MRTQKAVELAAAKMLKRCLERLVKRRRKLKKRESERVKKAAKHLNLDSHIDLDELPLDLNLNSVFRNTSGQIINKQLSVQDHISQKARQLRQQLQQNEQRFTVEEKEYRTKNVSRIQKYWKRYRHRKAKDEQEQRLASNQYIRAQRWRERMESSVLRIDLAQVQEDILSEKRLPNKKMIMNLRHRQEKEIAKEAVKEANDEMNDIKEEITDTISDVLRKKDEIEKRNRQRANANEKKLTRTSPMCDMNKEQFDSTANTNTTTATAESANNPLEIELIKALEYVRMQQRTLADVEKTCEEMERAIEFYIDRVGGNAEDTVLYNEQQQRKYLNLLENRKVTLSTRHMKIQGKILAMKDHINEGRREKMLTCKHIHGIEKQIYDIKTEQLQLQRTMKENKHLLTTYIRQIDILNNATNTKMATYEINWKELKLKEKQEKSEIELQKKVTSRNEKLKQKKSTIVQIKKQRERIYSDIKDKQNSEEQEKQKIQTSKSKVKSYMLAFRKISEATGVKTPDDLIQFVETNASRNHTIGLQITSFVAEQLQLKEAIKSIKSKHNILKKRLYERRGKEQKELNRLEHLITSHKQTIEQEWNNSCRITTSIKLLKTALHDLFEESHGQTWENIREKEDLLKVKANMEQKQQQMVQQQRTGGKNSKSSTSSGNAALRSRQRRGSFSVGAITTSTGTTQSFTPPSTILEEKTEYNLSTSIGSSDVDQEEESSDDDNIDGTGFVLGNHDRDPDIYSTIEERKQLRSSRRTTTWSSTSEISADTEASQDLHMSLEMKSYLNDSMKKIRKQRCGEFMDSEILDVLSLLDSKIVEILFRTAGSNYVHPSAKKNSRGSGGRSSFMHGAEWGGQPGLISPLGPILPLNSGERSIKLFSDASKRTVMEVNALTSILGTKPSRDGHFDIKNAKHQQDLNRRSNSNSSSSSNSRSGSHNHHHDYANDGLEQTMKICRENIVSIATKYIPVKKKAARGVVA